MMNNNNTNIPNDPIILLSYINTKLRDEYPSLKELCLGLDVNQTDLIDKLNNIGYKYSEESNRFI